MLSLKRNQAVSEESKSCESDDNADITPKVAGNKKRVRP